MSGKPVGLARPAWNRLKGEEREGQRDERRFTRVSYSLAVTDAQDPECFSGVFANDN